MKIKLLTIASLILFATSTAPVASWAQVTGQCADCHTMHNSQGGAEMALAWDDTTFTTSSPGGPFAKLLRRDGCLGCHVGTRTAGTNMLANAPKVLSTSVPLTYGAATSDCSAGGNFWWTKTNDAAGHNVTGMMAVDGTLSYSPPGYDAAHPDPDGDTRNNDVAVWTTQLTCAGINGCHGAAAATDDFTAISGAHHGADATLDGSSCAQSYRFLNGVIGIEDEDWEHTNAANDHNQYHGIDRTNATVGTGTGNDKTISYLCCQCHGVFHSAASASGTYSPWLRHPTDFDMGNVATVAADKEYQFYNGGSAGNAPYSTTAPVGSDLTVAGLITTGVQAVVFNEADDAIVTCISCHRAHGSPYDDILRWDYADTYAANVDGDGNSDTTMDGDGCFICHTTKDD